MILTQISGTFYARVIKNLFLILYSAEYYKQLAIFTNT